MTPLELARGVLFVFLYASPVLIGGGFLWGVVVGNGLRRGVVSA